jgi:D-tagatose-1,6-bisphosphate aldolase subunit GatZ/KbaZ
MSHPLDYIPRALAEGRPEGLTSVCSAHPLVVEAALRHGLDGPRPVLIEATCNQVNQEGGYTGMTPRDFRVFVEETAARVGFDTGRLVLGGDHLGPNPWRNLPVEDAMARAEAMVEAYAAAGFTKLHLDCSMGCAGEPAVLTDDETAERAARLVARAEAAAGTPRPVYVIGTEVPVPGGAVEVLDHLQITRPEAVAETYRRHEVAFRARGLGEAFGRVIGLVVQPGVEFGHSEVVHFAPGKAEALSASLSRMPGVVFEAHSTDYQTQAGLTGLVRQGFAILKVGPWLTFALREALYALDHVADILEGSAPRGGLMTAMERLMVSKPSNWARYYQGDERALFLQRHFSYSDRIRYYWPDPEAQEAVSTLERRLAGKTIPLPLLGQYVPELLSDLPPENDAVGAREVARLAIERVLKIYAAAERPA